MKPTIKSLLRLLAILLTFTFVAAACGSDEDTSTDTGGETDDGDAATSDDEDGDAMADDEDGDAMDDDAMADDDHDGDGHDFSALTVAIVAPSASDDLAFTQSMVDSVKALGIEPQITDGTFVLDDAAAAIRGYAEDGVNVVIAHGTQYGASLLEIAPDFPETSFIWGTATDTQGLDNVFAYFPDADEGGYVHGVLAAQLSSSGVIGVVGPVEAGDAVAYINGFAKGAEDNGATVNITYTGSFGDVALAAEAAQAHLTQDVDVLTGTAQMVVGAVGVASENDIPWFGTQSNQTSLDPDLVVASQVYHWEVILEEMLMRVAAGRLGGDALAINLENGGLVIELNDQFDLPDGAAQTVEDTIAGIIDGSIDTGA
ncbi:MAG: BMP family ABC transporter substrate-binding protein [Acidimicrobiales bacterium]